MTDIPFATFLKPEDEGWIFLITDPFSFPSGNTSSSNSDFSMSLRTSGNLYDHTDLAVFKSMMCHIEDGHPLYYNEAEKFPTSGDTVFLTSIARCLTQ